MFRHVLTILLAVTLLAGAGLLLLGRFGKLNAPPQVRQGQDTAAPTPAPVPEQPQDVQPHTVPEVPAPPISPTPESQPAQTEPPEPVATRPVPVAPVPSVFIPPQTPPKATTQKKTATKPAPTPPRPVVNVPAQPHKAAPATIPSLPQESMPSAPAVLSALNATRALANQRPVTTQPQWQAQCAAHANYLTVTDTGQHSEDPADPHYSAQGAACAHGHYYVTMRPEATAAQAIRYWANGPFHLPQLLDPRLKTVALAVKHDTTGDIHTAVVLDVKRGRTGTGSYPVKFPAPGRKVTPQALSQFEYPDSLPGCPGYTHPVGAPIALLLGQGKTVQSVTLSVNGKRAEVCLLTAETFQGGSAGDTRVGRSVLAAQGVAVALPRQPLPDHANVKVSFTTAQGQVSWAFQTH